MAKLKPQSLVNSRRHFVAEETQMNELGLKSLSGKLNLHPWGNAAPERLLSFADLEACSA